MIGLILLAIIIWRSNLAGIFQSLKNIKIIYLIFAVLMLFPLLAAKALCWNYLMRRQGIYYNFKESLLIYWAGFYLGFVTPGRLGEFAKIFYLKSDGHSLGKSLVSVILDRVSDLFFLTVFACSGFLFFAVPFQGQILGLLSGIIIFIVLFFVSFRIGLVKFLFKKLFFFFVPAKYQESWQVNFHDFIENIKIYGLGDYLAVFLITGASWFFYYWQMYILARGMNLAIPFLYFAVALTVAGFITLIPISVSGIGTRDIALIFLFSPFLIAKEEVIAFSALVLLMSVAAAFIGFFCRLIKPLKGEAAGKRFC